MGKNYCINYWDLTCSISAPEKILWTNKDWTCIEHLLEVKIFRCNQEIKQNRIRLLFDSSHSLVLSKVFTGVKKDYFVHLYELWGKIQKQRQIKQNMIFVLLARANSVQSKKKWKKCKPCTTGRNFSKRWYTVNFFLRLFSWP